MWFFQRLMVEHGGTGEAAPSLHRRLWIKKTLEHPRTCCLNQGVKATNFASYKVAMVADCSRVLPLWSAHSCFQGYVEIVGYNQRTTGWGGEGWHSPSSPALVKVLQSESGGRGSSDWTFSKPTHILVCWLFAFCLFPLAPLPFSSLDILFSRKRFPDFPVGERRGTTSHGLAWSWHRLC